MAVRIHIKNNRWAEGSFPNTPEQEAVFSITPERFATALAAFPQLQDKIAPLFDWDTDRWAESMAHAEVLLAWKFPTEDFGAVAPNLKWIHVISAGVEQLCPMDWLPPGVAITNNKGVHAAKAGEYGLMAVLMLHSHMPALIANQQQRRYVSLFASPIAGRVLVVLGTGSLGGAIAKQCAALGVHVIGVNRRGEPVEGCAEVVTTDALDRVLPRADFLVAATPDTPATRGLLDRRRLALLKPGAGVVNIGREHVMDYDALCDLLEAGHLGGAILDVFDPEPIAPDSRLWSVPRLVITPHVSADDGDHYVALTLELFFRNLERHLAGQPLLNPVDPVAGY